jgi:hypothetical protein
MGTNEQQLMNTNAALATLAFWRINCCWNGHQQCNVGFALRTLNGARNLVGPQRSIYWKISQLINEIVHNQVESTSADTDVGQQAS